MRLNIGLWGAGTLENVGDQLIAATTRAELARRLPHARFRQFSPWNPDSTTERLWIDALGRWSGTGQFDAVVVSGGGVFAGPPFRHPVMQVFSFGVDPCRFDPDVMTAWNAVGVQDGTPAADGEWQQYVGALRDRLEFCSVRSQDTADRIAGAASGRRPSVVPDPAFSLQPNPMRPQRRSRPRVGVALGHAVPQPRLLASLVTPDVMSCCPFNPATCLPPAAVVALEQGPADHARKQGFVPAVVGALTTLAPHIDVEFFGFGRIYGDDELAEVLAALVPGARLAASWNSLDDLMALIGSYDGLVLSRYHAAILALRADRPFVAADPHWSTRTGTSKLHQLMTQLSLGDRWWTTRTEDDHNSRALAGAVEVMLRGPSRGSGLFSDLHAQSHEHFDRLAAAIADHASSRRKHA